MRFTWQGHKPFAGRGRDEIVRRGWNGQPGKQAFKLRKCNLLPDFCQKEAIAVIEKLEALAEELNIKCHFWVHSAPEHVAYTLIEADDPGAVTRFVQMAIPYRQDHKVMLVQDTQELVALGKAIREQR